MDAPTLFTAARLPTLATAVFFVALFAHPLATLLRDWWTKPEAGHGLLLAPVSLWLAWRAGLRSGAAPNQPVGLALIVMAVVVRCAAGLAAELFTMRASIVMALAGLTVFHYGLRQLLHWWLPFSLASLSIRDAICVPRPSCTIRPTPSTCWRP